MAWKTVSVTNQVDAIAPGTFRLADHRRPGKGTDDEVLLTSHLRTALPPTGARVSSSGGRCPASIGAQSMDGCAGIDLRRTPPTTTCGHRGAPAPARAESTRARRDVSAGRRRAEVPVNSVILVPELRNAPVPPGEKHHRPGLGRWSLRRPRLGHHPSRSRSTPGAGGLPPGSCLRSRPGPGLSRRRSYDLEPGHAPCAPAPATAQAPLSHPTCATPGT